MKTAHDTQASTWTTLDRTLHLKTLPGLSGLHPSDLALIARHARARRFVDGEVIIRPTAPPPAVQMIVTGTVRATGAGHSGQLLRTGQSIGMLSVLARRAGLEAVAVGNVETLEFTSEAVLDVYEDHFHLLHNQIRGLAQRTLELRRSPSPNTYLATWDTLIDAKGRDLDLVERLVVLRRAGPFHRTRLGALAEIARQMEELRFDTGQSLWRRDDPSGYLLAIVSGTVRCEPGAEAETFRCGPGYPLGNVESLAREPRWFHAIAETPVVTLRSETETFLDVLEDHFEMASDFLAAMASNVIHLIEEAGPIGAATKRG